MPKRHWFFDLVALVILGTIIFYVYLSGYNLRGQVLDTPSTTMSPTTTDACLLLAETAANDCLLQLAIIKKDDSICDSISKASQRIVCQREVELTP